MVDALTPAFVTLSGSWSMFSSRIFILQKPILWELPEKWCIESKILDLCMFETVFSVTRDLVWPGVEGWVKNNFSSHFKGISSVTCSVAMEKSENLLTSDLIFYTLHWTFLRYTLVTHGVLKYVAAPCYILSLLLFFQYLMNIFSL